MPRHSGPVTLPQGILYKLLRGVQTEVRHCVPPAILWCSIASLLLKVVTHFNLNVGVLSFLIFWKLSTRIHSLNLQNVLEGSK